MNQVIKVSKQGVNVLTATDPNDFIFDSTLNTFKITSQGTYSPTFGTTSSEATGTLAHGLGATPFVIAFCKFSDGLVGGVGSRSMGTPYFWFNTLKVDSTNIYFNYSNYGTTSYSPVFKYYVVEPPI